MDENKTAGGGLSFEGENSSLLNRSAPEAVLPKLVALVLKTGWVKTREQANWTLLGVAICATLIAVVVFATSIRTSKGHDELDPFAHPGISPR